MKKLKHFLQQSHLIYWLGRRVRICLELLKFTLNGFYLREMIKTFSEGTVLEGFGKIKIILNLSVSYERKLVFDKREELNWVHGMKLFLSSGQRLVFINPPSAFLPVFFSKMTTVNVEIVTNKGAKFQRDIEKNGAHNCRVINELENYGADLVFIFRDVDYDSKFQGTVFHIVNKTKLVLPKSTIQKNIDGRFFELDQMCSHDSYINFYKIEKLDALKNQVNGSIPKKISGATYLRSPEIYPFDLCYESVLDVADEFVFGLDDVLQVHNEEEIRKRKLLIEKFMDQLSTKNREKIIFEKFDFKARYNKNLNIPAKWLVDVSNRLLDRCHNETVCFVQADEMYHEKNFEQILEFSRQQKSLALKHEFLHFLFDLKQIRNPENVAYTHAVRVFKKNYYSCTGDGYTFVSLKGKNDLPCEEVSKYPIYHLGYVIDFRKKMEAHLAEGGLFDFKDKKVNKDEWIDKADVVKYDGAYPKYLFLENKINSEKIKQYTVGINQ